MAKIHTHTLKVHQRFVTASMIVALSTASALALSVRADAADKGPVVTSSAENHYLQQDRGATVEYGGLKYSVLSSYVAQNHEAVAWEMRMLVGTKSSQVGIFTDQLQPGQYFYTGATPNHYILSDGEWQKATGQQDSYGDLTVRVGTRYLDDKNKNGADLQTGTLKYIAPEYLAGIKLDAKMAKAGGLTDPKNALTVTPSSDDSPLIKSGYAQGDKDKTSADKSQIQQLMALVKTQAETAAANTGTDADNSWNPAGSTDTGKHSDDASASSSSDTQSKSVDYSALGKIGVKEGPNGFYTYDADAHQLKFVVYNLERVKADSEIIASVIKSLGGNDKVENAAPSDVANAAEKEGAPSDVVNAINGADTLVVSGDDTLLALNFTNLYMHEIRIMVPMAVEAGNIIPNQYDFAGATWDGTTLGDIPPFVVSDKPKVLVPGTKEKPADPDKPYKNVLAGDTLTLQNGYNFYGKAADDTINADNKGESKSGEASFSAGAPLTFSKDGTYAVKNDSVFAPGVYIVRTLDGKAISAAADGTVLRNGELLSVNAGSQLKVLEGSGQFQLVDATSAFARVASAQAVAKIGNGKNSKVITSDQVKGKDAALDALISSASTGNTQWTWVVSQPMSKDLQNVKNVDVKLIDNLAQDSLVSLKIVDTKTPSKVIEDVTADAKRTLTDNNKTVADALKDGKSADTIKDADGLQLSNNLLIYRLKDYTAAKYGDTVSFAITVKGASNTDHKDTASTQIFNKDKSLTDAPQSTNTVKVITAQPKVVDPTNPVQPGSDQNPKEPGTPTVIEPPYVPAGGQSGRIDNPVSEKLGDVANSDQTPGYIQPLAQTGAYIASSLWFLILFPVALFGTVGEIVYKKKTGNWFTFKELFSKFAK